MTYVSSFLVDIGHGRLRWRVYASEASSKENFVSYGKGHGDEILAEVIKRVLEEHRLQLAERDGAYTNSGFKHVLNLSRDGKFLAAEELHT